MFYLNSYSLYGYLLFSFLLGGRIKSPTLFEIIIWGHGNGVDVKINLSDMISKIRLYTKNVMKDIAVNIRDDITNTTADALDQFYNDYTPKIYKRHWDIHNFINRGDRLKVNSFKKYYVHASTGTYKVGVLLSPYADAKQYKSPMKDVYSGSVEQVFYSVYHGFHGLPTTIHRMTPTPLEIIENKRDYIINHLQDYIDKSVKKYQYILER